MTLLRKSVLNISGTAIFSIINLAIGILLARSLSPAGLGQYALVISVVSLVAYISGMGIGQASIYYLNNQKKDPEKVTTHILKFSSIVSILLVLILIPILHYQPFFGEIPLWAILGASVLGVGLLFACNLGQILISFLEIKRHIVIRLVPGFILLLLVVMSLLVGHFNVNLAWIYFAIGQGCGVAVLLWFLKPRINLRLPFEWREVRSLLSYGSKLNLAYAIHLLNGELGLLLVRYFTDDFTEVGYYRVSVRVGGLLLLFGGSIGPILYSKWSSVKNIEDKRLQVERVSRIFWLILFLGVGALELLSGYLIPLIYGNEYLPAVPVLRILLLGMGARFLLIPFFQMFSSSGKPLMTSLVLGVGLLLMIVLMSILVPRYAGIGAASAFAISNCVALLFCYTISSKKFTIAIHKCFLLTKEDLLSLFSRSHIVSE